jgi:hypothetical protein
MIGQNQANLPGYTSALGVGAVGAAQTLELMVAEIVPGGESPSSGNFTTALSAAATDLGTLLSTAGAFGGNAGTPLSLIQAWSTGGP